jgi:hypothetical protein
MRPPKTINSLDERSAGSVLSSCIEEPNRTFIQLLKKKVGPIRYKSTIKTKHSKGNRSKKKLKNRISATNIIDPGNPRKIKQLIRLIRNSLGHKKLTPFISVISRVLKRRPMASTNRKELVERRAWLISIQKLANINAD